MALAQILRLVVGTEPGVSASVKESDILPFFKRHGGEPSIKTIHFDNSSVHVFYDAAAQGWLSFVPTAHGPRASSICRLAPCAWVKTSTHSPHSGRQGCALKVCPICHLR